MKHKYFQTLIRPPHTLSLRKNNVDLNTPYLIFLKTIEWRYCYPHFTIEKSETQVSYLIHKCTLLIKSIFTGKTEVSFITIHNPVPSLYVDVSMESILAYFFYFVCIWFMSFLISYKLCHIHILNSLTI